MIKEKLAVVILGCPKNEVDAEIFTGEVIKNKFEVVNNIQDANIVVVFTCAFITEASQESIDTILEIASLNKRVIVTGCLPSRYPINTLQKLIPEVECFFDTYNYLKIINYLKNENYTNSQKFIYNHNYRRFIDKKDYAYIKIAEGCNNRCSFCTIPLIKGNLFSRSIKDIVTEVKKIADQGIKEIIIVSQNNGKYGKDLKDNTNIIKLLENLFKLEQIRWIRMLYIYPDDITDDFLSLTKNRKFCNYLDIPIQHIDNDILKSMNRKTSEDNIRKILDKIKTNYSDLFLRTSLIVGHPGEDDKKFLKLLDFIKEYEFYNLGCFIYSDEEGTKSSTMEDRTPKKIKKLRYNKIMQTQKNIVRNINKSLIGKVFEVNISGFSEETELLLKGRTEFQAPDIDGITYVNKGNIEKIGFYNVKITDFKEYDLIGEIV